MIKLFTVTSTLQKLMGKENVDIVWLYKGRNQPIAPYDQIIEDYNPNSEKKSSGELAVNEMFTLEEAEELATFLRDDQKMNLKVIEMDLPIAKDRVPLTTLPMGPQNGQVPVEFEGLPFEVYFHFDLREKA